MIATNSEQFISLQLKGLRFIDSFQFLYASLEKLVANLRHSGVDKFRHSIRHFGRNEYRLAKGVFPYEYMNSSNRFTETRLPAKEKFCFHLTEEDITHGEYLHVHG